MKNIFKEIGYSISGISYASCMSAIVALCGLSFWSVQYADNWLLAWDKDYTSGKIKNGLATMVAHEVARDLSSNAEINLKVKRTLWFDGNITGTVGATKGNVYIDGNKAVFESTIEQGKLTGKVRKHELDWKVEEGEDGKLKIRRWGPKFNSYLDVKADNGFIKGKYDRRGFFKPDWKVQGTYDDEGNVNVKINVPFGGDVNLEGKIYHK